MHEYCKKIIVIIKINGHIELEKRYPHKPERSQNHDTGQDTQQQSQIPG